MDIGAIKYEKDNIENPPVEEDEGGGVRLNNILLKR